MRQWIAVASLFSLIAFAGCQTSMDGMAALPASSYHEVPPTTVRSAAPQELPPRPAEASSFGAPDGTRQSELRSTAIPAPGPSASAPPQPDPLPPAPATPPPPAVAPAPSGPSAEEIAQALKENEDALATLRTAERALEASHKKLEELLKRQQATQPVFSFWTGATR